MALTTDRTAPEHVPRAPVPTQIGRTLPRPPRNSLETRRQATGTGIVGHAAVAAAVAAAVSTGALERWWVATHPLGTLTSDGSVIGLMALDLLHHGHLPAYMWGQSYGGSLEALLTAGVFAVWRSGTGPLLATTALSSALATLALWRAARRIVGERAALIAALAFWVWPATALWRSVKPGGSYMIGLALAWCAVGALIRIRSGDRRWHRCALCGVWCGLAFWTSPMSLQLLLPAALYCFPALVRLGRRASAVVAGAVAGAAPALVFGATHHWSNLEMPGGSRGVLTALPDRVAQFFAVELPIALSLRVEGSLAWVGGVLGMSLYAAAIAAAAAVAMATAGLVLLGLLGRGRMTSCGFPALTLGLLPLLFALNPMANHVGQGRYVLFGASAATLVVGVGLDRIELRWQRRGRGRHRRLAVWPVGLAALAILGIVALGMEPVSSLVEFAAPDAPMPVDDSGLLALVAAHHVHDAYANYWIAYRITFETNEQTLATPYDFDRYRPLAARVDASASPAYLFVSASTTLRRFEHWCARHGVGVTVWQRGGFTVVQPATKVVPAQVPPGLLT
jgi:Dolichyl-phosphate-mannose-protein mannosyltransferase